MDKQKRLEHAYHNESTCNYLNDNGSFNDWVITTAFYSALHFVCYKIFPIHVQVNGKPDVEIKTVEQYKRYHNLMTDKHSILSNLVYEKFPQVSNQYDDLFSTCITSRYHQYNTKKVIVERALKNLQHIKQNLGFLASLAEQIANQ